MHAFYRILCLLNLIRVKGLKIKDVNTVNVLNCHRALYHLHHVSCNADTSIQEKHYLKKIAADLSYILLISVNPKQNVAAIVGYVIMNCCLKPNKNASAKLQGAG